MGETFIDGRGNYNPGGSEYIAGVSADNRILTAGSITSMPSITTTVSNIYQVSGIISNTGSVGLIGAHYNGSVWALRMDAGSYLMFAGSISSMPSVTTTAADVKAVGTPIPGSVSLVGGNFNGSTVGFLTTAGSELIMTGSVRQLGLFNIDTGSIRVISSPIDAGSIYGIGIGSIFSLVTGSIRQLTDPWIILGSTQITNPTVIGSFTTQTIIGSVGITTSPIPISGALGNVAGSFAITTTPVPISGIINVNAGSIRIMGVSGGTSMPLLVTSGTEAILRVDVNTTPIGTGIGSIRIAEQGINLTGSVNITSDPVPVSGGVIIRAGSIQTYSPIGVGSIYGIGIGSVYSLVTGSVNINTTPLPISGTSLLVSGAGIFTIAGSVRQLEEPWKTEQIRGIFNWSGTTFTGSFTGSNIITAGAGSKLFLKGFTVSSHIGTEMRLFFSGGTSTSIGQWMMPNSGTIAMNLIGMEPSGATNQPLAIGLFNAGSIYISVSTRDTL